MTKRVKLIILSIVFGVFALHNSSGQAQVNVTLFGPESFLRSTESPQIETRTFSLPSIVKPPYLMLVINGNPDGTNRASSCRVALNGVEVFRGLDFNQQVAQLQRSVVLAGQNVLEVELRSAPGSLLRVSIVGVVESSAERTLVTLADQISSGSVAAALTHFAPSELTRDTLLSLDASNRMKFALALRSARLIRATGNLRVYNVPFVEQDGTTSNLQISLVKTGPEEWLVTSW